MSPVYLGRHEVHQHKAMIHKLFSTSSPPEFFFHTDIGNAQCATLECAGSGQDNADVHVAADIRQALVPRSSILASSISHPTVQ